MIYALKSGDIIAEKPPVVHKQAAVSGEKCVELDRLKFALISQEYDI